VIASETVKERRGDSRLPPADRLPVAILVWLSFCWSALDSLW